MGAAEWYYSANGQRQGPITVGELKRLARDGEIASTDLVWKEGMAEWTPASKIKGLIPAREPAANAPPPVPIPGTRAPTAGTKTVAWLWVILLLSGAGLLLVAFVTPWWGITLSMPSSDSSGDLDATRAFKDAVEAGKILQENRDWYADNLGSRKTDDLRPLGRDKSRVTVRIWGWGAAGGIVGLLSGLVFVVAALLPVFLRVIRPWAWTGFFFAGLLGLLTAILALTWLFGSPSEGVERFLSQGPSIGTYLAALGGVLGLIAGGIGGAFGLQRWLRSLRSAPQIDLGQE